MSVLELTYSKDEKKAEIVWSEVFGKKEKGKKGLKVLVGRNTNMTE